MKLCWFAVTALVFMHLLATLSAATATNIIPAREYDVRFWETDDGLPQNSVLAMAQTRDGYLWLGTQNGLARFDGNRFTVFDESNTRGLNSGHIVYLFEDTKANLWIGTESAGIVVMKNGAVTAPVELSVGGTERKLIAACEDSEGAVWLLLANGDLWRYHRDRFTPYVLPAREPSQAVTIIKEPSGPVWLATGRRQFAIPPPVDGGSLALPVQQEITAGLLNLLVPGRRAGYWRLANFDIQKWETNHFETVGDYRWFERPPSVGCEDMEGNLIVGTARTGVFIISGSGEITSLTTSNGLSRNNIRSLLVDREGTLWVGTELGGLNRVMSRVKLRPFQAFDAMRGSTVTSVAEDPSGGLWIGSLSGVGYWRSNSFTLQPGLFNNLVTTIFVDREGRPWAGTEGGLHVYRNGRFELVRSEVVQAIHQDRADRIWFGTRSGLLLFATNRWSRFTTRDGLDSENIRAIADSSSGGIWIGAGHGGVSRWSDGRITVLRESGAPTDISGLYEDKEGVLWVASFNNGLSRFHNGKWTRYTKRDGLASHNLGYLIEDDDGNLWIGSFHGLLRIPKKALNGFAAGTAQSIPCHAYGKADGLPTRECTSGFQPAVCRGHDGRLWFSTVRGLASVDPKQIKPNPIPPLVTIEAVLVDDVPVANAPTASTNRTIVLGPQQERLVIEYSSLNLSAPDRARFRYRLENREIENDERDWTETMEKRVDYKLNPGNYVFRVSACNEDGVWNEMGASLAIVVQTPFWKTWWFYGATAVSLITFVSGIVYYASTLRLQRQLVQLRQKEALEKERARIARDIHDQVGASLTQVALLGELVETDKDLPEEVEAHAKQISQTARETTHALDEIVWTVNPSNDTLEGLVNYICKHAQDYLRVAGLRYRLEVPEQLPDLSMSPEVRHNVFLASKEAVTNIVRHAKATAAWVRLQLETKSFTVEIEDNGCGIADPDAPSVRNGLRNMRKRMEEIGGTFSIGRGAEGGALVRLTVPIVSNNMAAVAKTK